MLEAPVQNASPAAIIFKRRCHQFNPMFLSQHRFPFSNGNCFILFYAASLDFRRDKRIPWRPAMTLTWKNSLFSPAHLLLFMCILRTGAFKGHQAWKAQVPALVSTAECFNRDTHLVSTVNLMFPQADSVSKFLANMIIWESGLGVSSSRAYAKGFILCKKQK